MRRLRRALALAIALSAALPALRVHAADGALAFYELCVNGRCGDAAGVLSDGEGRYWIDAAALAALGIDSDAWPSRDDQDTRYVDPTARYPDARIDVDDASLRLELTLPASAWPARSYDARRERDRPEVAPDARRSAYLDYSVYKSDHADPSAFGELGIVQGAWLLHSSFDADGDRLHRGVTALEFDQPRHRRRWTVGDQYLVAGDAFGAAGLVGGIGVASAWDLDPYLVTFPGADVRGVMQAPGTVEVYANGTLVSRQELDPGPFSLQDLSLAQGSNDVRIVVNDPFAGSYEIDSRYYASTRLLARGLQEYAYRVGQVRPSLRDGGYDGGTLLSAWHRYGFTDWLTAGARYERLDEHRNAGVAFDLRLPLGSVSFAIARGSDGDGHAGWARRIDYAYQARHFGIGFGGRRQDDGYMPLQTAASSVAFEQSIGDRYASLTLALPRQATASARYSRLDYADDSRITTTGLRLGMRIGARAQLSVDVGRREERDGSRGTLWQLSFYLPLDTVGFGFNASRQDGDPLDYVASMQRTAPTFDTGWGYRAELGRQGGDPYAFGEYERTDRFGRLDLTADRRNGQDGYSARFSGSLLWAGGDLYPVQTGTEGHALVRTAGMDSVPVQREHQDVGSTDADGKLLVPGLLPYQSNLIGIDPKALDVGVQVDEAERYVSMRRHGVAYVDFAVSEVSAVQAYLGVAGGDGMQRLKYGNAVLDDAANATPVRIGEDGQVYLEDVAPGAHVLHATGDDGSRYRCAFEVHGGDAMAWLGEVACTRE